MKTTQGTEYSVLLLDRNGEAIDTDYHDLKSKAIDVASKSIGDDIFAAVVERYWRKHRDDGKELEREEEVVATFGDQSALIAGGWLCDGCYRSPCECLPDDCPCDPN